MIFVFFGLLLVTIVFLLMLVVFGFTLRALSSVLLIPGQAASLFTNESVRRNEALKHATMNVIEERFGPSGLNGVSQTERLHAGRRRAARHRARGRAGGAATVARRGAASGDPPALRAGHRDGGPSGRARLSGILLAIDRLNLLNVVLAVMVANVVAPFAGTLLQKLLPRYTDVSDLRIVGLAGSPLAGPESAAPRAAREHFEIRTTVSK